MHGMVDVRAAGHGSGEVVLVGGCMHGMVDVRTAS